MTELGSIFDGESGDGEPGRDLRYEVTLNRDELGAPASVEVPKRLAATGGYAERRINPADDGELLKLSLPRDTVSGTTVRLRGMGEVGPRGRAGDLYIRVLIDESPGRKGSLAQVGGRGDSPATVALALVGGALFVVVVALVVSLL